MSICGIKTNADETKPAPGNLYICTRKRVCTNLRKQTSYSVLQNADIPANIKTLLEFPSLLPCSMSWVTAEESPHLIDYARLNVYRDGRRSSTAVRRNRNPQTWQSAQLGTTGNGDYVDEEETMTLQREKRLGAKKSWGTRSLIESTSQQPRKDRKYGGSSKIPTQ